MVRVVSIIVFSFVFLAASQSVSEGKLTPLVYPGKNNNQTTVMVSTEVEKKTDQPVLLASNQSLDETIYDEEDIAENSSEQEDAGPECVGTLFGTRWCDNHNGTVTDLTTGLIWLKDASWGGAYPFWADSIAATNAVERAAQVEPGNPESLDDNSVKGDWRLPTVSELKALTSGHEAVSTFNTQAFTDVQPDWYWSATVSEAGSDSALNVGMHFGNVNNSNKSYNYQVWPVRSGKD